MPAPPPSSFDGNQVLQHSFDEATGCIRVCATLQPGGTSDIIITHEDDSIRIGDGVNLVTTTTIGSDVALDVNVVGGAIDAVLDPSGVGEAPNIANVAMAVAGSEYSFAIPADTRRLEFSTRNSQSKLQFSFSAGQSGTNYISVRPGNTRVIDTIETAAPQILYFQSNKAADTLEIMYWT